MAQCSVYFLEEVSERPEQKMCFYFIFLLLLLVQVGENGAGKTTLLKILMDQLTPSSGDRTCHRGLKFGYFSQHHVDQLDMDVSIFKDKLSIDPQ